MSPFPFWFVVDVKCHLMIYRPQNNLYFFLEGVGISLPPTDTRTKPRTTRAYLQKSRTEQPKRR